MGRTLTTDATGLVTYDIPEREYKVRGDYLGYQWWSDPITWTASDVVIPEGEVTITVTDSGVPAEGVKVYVFTSGGSYMGLYATTDTGGEVSFLLPADGGSSTNYNGYKFRADYSGTQTWSDPLLVTADVNNPVSIEVGGSAALLSPPSALSPPPLSKEIQLASLDILPGMLAQLVNTTLPDSNGEYLYFYHSDHLGTPLLLTDVSGTVVWKGEYLPFGEIFTEDKDPDGDGVEVDQPFRFPGQYEDAETGLYYNYFRDYDPQLGRYVEKDAIGLEGGVNIFSYVENNPIVKLDHLGLSSCESYLMRYPKPDWEGYFDCVFYNVLKPGSKKAIASFGNCIRCVTICTADVALGVAVTEIGRKAAEKALEKTLKNKALELARRYAQKAIPILGEVDIVLTVYGIAKCTTKCAKL